MRECTTVAGHFAETNAIQVAGSSGQNPSTVPKASVAATAPRKKRKAEAVEDTKSDSQKKQKNDGDFVAPTSLPEHTIPSGSKSKYFDDSINEVQPAPPLPTPKPLPPLGRVVIPAQEYKHKLGVFTCRGQGIMKDGFTFDSVEVSLPPLHPVLTKAGKVAKRQPIPPKRPLTWWKAQCVFRGLKQQGKIEDLQSRLRSAGGMLEELRALEAQLDEEFRRKNAAAREERWARLETDGQKADEDAERFLLEKYRGANPAREAVIIKTYSRYALHAAAQDLGLDHESVEAPPSSDKHGIDKWIIIGPNHSIVAAKAREVAQEAVRMQQQIKDVREERIKKQHAELVSREGATPNMNWDVSGTWVIDCPYIEEQWGDQGQDECELVIGFSPASDGMRMWASFNFIVLTGVFRFARHGQDLDVEEEGDRDQSEDEMEEEYGYESGLNEDRPVPKPRTAIPTSNASQINTVRPSPANRRWEYKWRGSETGEGELQIEFECQMGSITFGGPGGTELFGEFESSLTDRIDFTGRKIRNDSIQVDDLSYE
jgi:hypothetical protein